MLVKDVMSTSLKTVAPDTPLAEVVTTMCLFRVSGIPVVEEDNRLVGIIAEKDVLDSLFPTVEEVMTESGTATMDLETALNKYADMTTKKVADLMTPGVISVSPDMEILKAAARMVGRRFRRIPVAEGERLVGMLSLGDVHKAIYREHAKRRL
ncbi:CBS domain-containing protein [endosymbiont of unidentified scaly snail isolate Monju]|uniref:CBS domain-containing protein n=1 Tax=endosymbiont of unidentified scaly snail isolate Monju TaxID=1248727 RepID=UPI0003891EDB|nr:CBS domain-containing protein [endosymbiont of unidentified scaly snail isolate Monju]BAN68735.1 poly(A) polymerase [endosymbiont of unidentified scaly snail isolate Monju]